MDVVTTVMEWNDVLGVLAVWSEHPELAAVPPGSEVVEAAYVQAERLMKRGLPAPRRIVTEGSAIRLEWPHGSQVLASGVVPF